MNWVLYLLLLAVQLFGLLINIVGLPGLWLMALAAGGYAWATHGRFLGPKSLVALLVIALVAEVIEFLASSAGAKKAGAGRRGLWGAIIGGIVGAIFFTLPFPIVGTLAGVLIGTFVGALVGELSGGTEVTRSLRVGVGAAKGRFVGTMSKLALGFVMLVVTLWCAIPFGGAKAPAVTPPPPPVVAPAPAGH